MQTGYGREEISRGADDREDGFRNENKYNEQHMNFNSGDYIIKNIYEADSILKEIALCSKELSKMKRETAKSIRLLKECAHSEEKEIAVRIANLKQKLIEFTELNSDKLKPSSGKLRSIDLSNGVIGFRKKIRYRTLSGRRTVKSIEMQMNTVLKKEANKTGTSITRLNLNKLNNEALKKFGITRDEYEEFYYIANES